MHPSDNEPHAPHEVTTALADVTSLRHRQQVCGLWLGLKQGTFVKEDLRTLCKLTASYNSPNFTRNMRTDAKLFDGDPKNGWTLTIDGYERACAMYGNDVQAAPKPEPKPTLADEVEKALAADKVACADDPAEQHHGIDENFSVPVQPFNVTLDDAGEIDVAPLQQVPVSDLGEVQEDLEKKVSAALGVPKQFFGVDPALGGGVPVATSPVVFGSVGHDAINHHGGVVDYKTADGTLVSGEILGEKGIPVYPEAQDMVPSPSVAGAVPTLDGTPAPTTGFVNPSPLPTGDKLAALQSSYQAKVKPAFVPPPHEERAPAKLADLAKKLGL